MPFTLGSRLTGDRPLNSYLAKATGHFQTVEISLEPSSFSNHFSLSPQQKKIIQVYQDQYHFNITVHAPFASSQLGSADRDERQLAMNIMRNTMRCAADLQAKYLTIHPFMFTKPDTSTTYAQNCRWEEESLSCLLKEAATMGLVLLMENMPDYPEYHPSARDGSRFQELLWLFPEREFGLTIDIGHALQAGVAVESLLKMDRIRHFHLHENDRRTDLHSAISTNLTWWRKLLATLHSKFPEATGILEHKTLDEQIESYQNLNPSPTPRGSKKRKKLPMPSLETE